MPYIRPEFRTALEFLNPLPSNAGELNYAISHLVHCYIRSKKGLSYEVLNSVHGVLHCADMELYRTVTAPYEDTKRAENGSVSEYDVPKQDVVKKELTADDVINALKGVQTITDAERQRRLKDDIADQRPDWTANKPATAAPLQVNPAVPVQVNPVVEPAKQPATSSVRRPAQVIGKSPMDGETEAPANVEALKALGPVKPPRGHTSGKGIDKHVASVWDNAANAKDEDYGI